MYEKLRALRNQRNIAAFEMAKLLGLKTKAAYYKKENGMIRFSLEEAKLIADKMGLPIDDIFFDVEVSESDTNTDPQSA